MKVFVKATTRAKEERVVQINTAHFEIAVKELAKEGKANKAILRALAKHLGVPQSSVKLVSGAASRHKRFEIY